MEEVGDVGFAGLDRNVMLPKSVIIPFWQMCGNGNMLRSVIMNYEIWIMN